MTTLWLIEDNPAYRRATERALRAADSARAIHAFASCEDALATPVSATAPDVVLLDVGLPGMDGITGLTSLKARAPEASVLILTVFEDDDKIFRAICAGASGYLLKSESMSRILAAIAEVQAGGSPMNPRIARRVLGMFSRFAPVKKDYGLTPRETDILQLMVEGAPKKQIADRLTLNPHTVDYAMRGIYRKLHVNCQTAAVSRAVQDGLFR